MLEITCRLVVLALVLAACGSGAPAADGPPRGYRLAFSDDFTDALGAGWQIVDPPGGASSAEAVSGALRLTADRGNDLYPNTNMDAPRVLRWVEGDFLAETRVTFEPTAYFHGAGVLVWQDERTFLRLERSFYKHPGFTFALVSAGEYRNLPEVESIATTSTRVDLRLRREGARVTAHWRDASIPSAAWQTLASTEVSLGRRIAVGVALVVEHAPGRKTADFDYFALWTP